jgi:hypothetical protein
MASSPNLSPRACGPRMLCAPLPMVDSNPNLGLERCCLLFYSDADGNLKGAAFSPDRDELARSVPTWD